MVVHHVAHWPFKGNWQRTLNCCYSWISQKLLVPSTIVTSRIDCQVWGIGGWHSLASDPSLIVTSRKCSLGRIVGGPLDPQYNGTPRVINLPVLCNICVKLVGELIQKFRVYCHQYAGDTQLCLSFIVDGVWALECYLALVLEWTKANRQKLNPR